MNWAAVREWFLPTLTEPDAAAVRTAAAMEERDLRAIDDADWARQVDVALAEARRLGEAETDRRKTADTRAAAYLAVGAAFVPLVVNIQNAIWQVKAGGAPKLLSQALLAIAVLYVAGAGLWAFRTLRVSITYRVDVGDLTRSWSGRKDPRPALVRQILRASRRNRDGVNEKVTGIRMAHAFLLRSFMTFALLLLVNAGWAVTGWVVDQFPIGKQQAAVWWREAANSEEALALIRSLAAQVSSEPSDAKLANQLCRSTNRREPEIIKVPITRPAAKMTVGIQKLLKHVPGERIVHRRWTISCGSRNVLTTDGWHIPGRGSPATKNTRMGPLATGHRELQTIASKRVSSKTELSQVRSEVSPIIQAWMLVLNEEKMPVAVVRRTVRASALETRHHRTGSGAHKAPKPSPPL
ncbi:hypothetical protein [Sphingomonas sp.]|jgi:hypothetical protein|uniref:hypothetical protein n=1 Tax=Sphingomonas sp. TaxID=28214 RepID=UPI002DEFA415|nr:hypothetical protein [Sphingomonas sp.]